MKIVLYFVSRFLLIKRDQTLEFAFHFAHAVRKWSWDVPQDWQRSRSETPRGVETVLPWRSRIRRLPNALTSGGDQVIYVEHCFVQCFLYFVSFTFTRIFPPLGNLEALSGEKKCTNCEVRLPRVTVASRPLGTGCSIRRNMSFSVFDDSWLNIWFDVSSSTHFLLRSLLCWRHRPKSTLKRSTPKPLD